VRDPSHPIRRELGPGYELFIVALSILSLVNVVIAIGPFEEDTKDVARIIDVILSAIFMADFAGRLYLSVPRSDYFVARQGWLDLLGSLPFPLLRVFRIVRVYRAIRRVREMGGRRVVRRIIRERAQSALLLATFLVLLVVEIGSILVVVAERNAPNANITTAGDALWWAVVSVTTVGYGDKYPVTQAGRIIGTLLLIGGVGLFGVFTGYVAGVFLTPRREDLEADDDPRSPSS
jgi:voltage-gated potassium channel Kch